jgi:hypothetical protein
MAVPSMDVLIDDLPYAVDNVVVPLAITPGWGCSSHSGVIPAGRTDPAAGRRLAAGQPRG